MALTDQNRSDIRLLCGLLDEDKGLDDDDIDSLARIVLSSYSQNNGKDTTTITTSDLYMVASEMCRVLAVSHNYSDLREYLIERAKQLYGVKQGDLTWK